VPLGGLSQQSGRQASGAGGQVDTGSGDTRHTATAVAPVEGVQPASARMNVGSPLRASGGSTEVAEGRPGTPGLSPPRGGARPAGEPGGEGRGCDLPRQG